MASLRPEQSSLVEQAALSNLTLTLKDLVRVDDRRVRNGAEALLEDIYDDTTVFTRKSPRQPGFTEVVPIYIEGANTLRLFTGIALDTEALASTHKDERRYDVARTLLVRDQFPENGYADSYTEIWERTFKRLAEFLAAEHAPLIPFDPRSSKMKALTAEFMTAREMAFDIGIVDVANHLRRFLNPGTLTQKEKEIFVKAANDDKKFVYAREKAMKTVSQERMIVLNCLNDRERRMAATGILMDVMDEHN